MVTTRTLIDYDGFFMKGRYASNSVEEVAYEDVDFLKRLLKKYEDGDLDILAEEVEIIENAITIYDEDLDDDDDLG